MDLARSHARTTRTVWATRSARRPSAFQSPKRNALRAWTVRAVRRVVMWHQDSASPSAITTHSAVLGRFATKASARKTQISNASLWPIVEPNRSAITACAKTRPCASAKQTLTAPPRRINIAMTKTPVLGSANKTVIAAISKSAKATVAKTRESVAMTAIVGFPRANATQPRANVSAV